MDSTSGESAVKRPVRSKRRIILRLIILTTVAIPLLLWFSAGWWFPSLLQFALRWTPVDAESIHYSDDGRLQFNALRYTAEEFRLEANQVLIPAPTRIIFSWLTGHRLPDIDIDEWQAAVLPTDAPLPDNSDHDTESEFHLPDIISSTIQLWQKWQWFIPHTTIRAGRVALGGEAIAVDKIIWRDDIFSLTAENSEWSSPVSISVALHPDNFITGEIALPDIRLLVNASVTATQDSATLESELHWFDGTAQLTAEWASQGIFPLRASVNVPDFIVPSELLRIDGYQQPVLSATVRGSVDDFSLAIHVRSEPNEDPSLPALELELAASGSGEEIDISTISITGDFVHGRLTQPVHFDLAHPDRINAAQFHFAANLDRQTILPVDGTIQGRIDIPEHTVESGNLPEVVLEFRAESVRWKNIPAGDLFIQARINWPTVSLDKLTLIAPGASADISGTVNVAEQNVEGGRISITITPEIAGTIPDHVLPFGFTSLHIDGSISGNLWDPEHAGTLRLEGAALPTVGSGEIIADWKGGAQSVRASVKAELEHLLARTTFSAARSGVSKWLVDIDSVGIHPSNGEALMLANPVRISFEPDPESSEALIPGTVALSPLTLRRKGDSSPVLSLHIPQLTPHAGEIHLQIDHLSSADAGDLLALPDQVRLLEIPSLALNLSWDNSPLHGTIRITATAEAAELSNLTIDIVATLNDQGVELYRFSVARDSDPALSGTAQLPIILSAAGSGSVSVDIAAPISARFSTVPGSPAWAVIEQLTGLRVDSPNLSVDLSGNLQAPRGSVQLSAKSITPPKLNPQLDLSIHDIQFHLLAGPEGLTLETFTFLIFDHPVSARGNWPISQSDWTAFLQDGTLPSHDDANVSLELASLPLNRLEGLLPEMVRPQGTASVTLTYQRENGLTGTITLQDAATFPLSSIGSITDIRGNIAIADYILSIDPISAKIGGEIIALNGTVDISDPAKPRLNLRTTAQNLPLLRQPGLILRAESIDVAIVTDNEDVTSIEGKILMAESFLLVDFNDLRSSTTSADNPPPFFSVKEEPFSFWRLNLSIVGDRFLRISTPVFDGIVSADFQLGGSLGIPISHGVASVQRGYIKFPFALFTVAQGEAAIDPSAPYTIRLNMDASGRAYGYDLRMQASGTAARPILQFSSTPTLENAEILLLVTAGRIPQGGTEMSGSSRLSSLGMFLGSTLLAELGLVDPYSDRLRIRVGEDVSAQGRDTIRVEFKINEEASFIGEYDRFDAYNLDFKYLIYSGQ